MSKPLVSIIMNCYNGEKFLKETLESVYAQTYTNWEVIFWDNLSTDNSKQIACSFDDKIKGIYNRFNLNFWLI
jgi:glycosyltransferase involved in cell wall biosynthesis